MGIIKHLYISKRVYIWLFATMALYILAFFFPILNIVPRALLPLLLILFIIDLIILFRNSDPVSIERIMEDRFSNGDSNTVNILLHNYLSTSLTVQVIDELPVQFQYRTFSILKKIPSQSTENFSYKLVPVERGTYEFGSTLAFLRSPLGLAVRRVTAFNPVDVRCYPGYKKLNQWQLKGVANPYLQGTTVQVKKIGSSMEFEQIKDYIKGDDIRNINWNATARRNQLMVNTYVDERSQQVYCIINKSRVMKMPFDGLTLLDYSINASLMLSHVVVNKNDHAGLITFSNKIDSVVKATNKKSQLPLLLNKLYTENTEYKEANFEKLYVTIRSKIPHRSLLLLFTNFESYTSMLRELPYLKKMAYYHLLIVVFFENTQIKELVNKNAHSLEDVYTKTIAEQFNFEKRKIVMELHNNGITALLTTPQDLTANAINKYIELKNTRAI